MKKNCSIFACSAVAMLMLSAVSACSKDETPAPSEVGGCYVTVSAGFPATKTWVDKSNDDVYSLYFSEGDRLYVHGTGVNTNEEGDWHMAGYLELKPNTNEGKRAEFDGTLDLYNYSEGVYHLADLATMNNLSGLTLDDCQDVTVCLIPAGATNDLLAEKQINEQSQLTSIDVYVKDAVISPISDKEEFEVMDVVSPLMFSAVDVRGKYDRDKKCIMLNQSDDAIFDVIVIELEGGQNYDVSLILDEERFPLAGTVYSYASGRAHFAISVGIAGQEGEAKLILSRESASYEVSLGTKRSEKFENKVYRCFDCYALPCVPEPGT